MEHGAEYNHGGMALIRALEKLHCNCSENAGNNAGNNDNNNVESNAEESDTSFSNLQILSCNVTYENDEFVIGDFVLDDESVVNLDDIVEMIDGGILTVIKATYVDDDYVETFYINQKEYAHNGDNKFVCWSTIIRGNAYTITYRKAEDEPEQKELNIDFDILETLSETEIAAILY